MKVVGYKLELKLTKQQRMLCIKSAGVARFAYNWKLGQLNENYEKAKQEAKELGLEKVKTEFGNYISWNRELVILKNELPWIREVSKCCGSIALRNLEYAFKRFFSKKSGYPKFKKRGQKDSFTLDSEIYLFSNMVQLPKLGKVRLKQKNYPCQEGRIKLTQATVSRQADRWFVSFFIKEDMELPKPSAIEDIKENDILGVDLGIKELGITSDGQTFKNPKAYKKYLRKIKRLQRKVSKKKKGSNNKKKAILRLSKVHMKVGNIRKDTIQKMTTSLIESKPKMIVMETLKPKNMSKNHKLAGAILDSAFGMIKQTLKYKCEWNGIHLVQVHQFYASSKFCSECGYKHKDLKLSDREWSCSNCGAEHDRDVNAAKNLQYYGLWMIDKHLEATPTTVSSTGSYACGDERLQFLIEQCSSMKQEFKSTYSSILIC